MTTFKTNDTLLKELLDDVGNAKMQLPDFQRPWVWDDEHIKGLLVSISRGFPVGAIMTLDSGGDVRFHSKPVESVTWDGTPDLSRYLLDGQQRLTALYQALRHSGPVKTRERSDERSKVIERRYYFDIRKALEPLIDRDEIIVSTPGDGTIRSNFGRDIVLDLSSSEQQFANHMIPSQEAMNGMSWGFKYVQYWQQRSGHPSGDPFSFFELFHDSVLKKFSEYLIPVINLNSGTSKEAVCTVFEKVNTGGVPLSVFELVTASFAADGFRLREDWTGRQQRLYSEFGVLQGIGGDQFLQAITLLATLAQRKEAVAGGVPFNQLPGIDCKRASILNLKLSAYRRWADDVEEGFREAAKFLHRQFVFTANNVPYNTQLIPLAALHVELGQDLLPANAWEKLNRWFWCGIFGEAYGGGVESQFALDLAQVADHIRGGPEPELVNQANFIPNRLLSLRTRNSAAYKGVYALQMKSDATDWRQNDPLNLATWHGGNIDIHHIFPKHWCEHIASPAIPSHLYDSVINKTPIDALTNQIIGGKAPSVYLPLLRKQNHVLDQTLGTHWINLVSLEKDLFPVHFVERGQAMLDLILLGKPSSDGRQTFHDALDASGLVEEDNFGEDEHDPIGEAAHDDTLGQESLHFTRPA